MARSYGHMNNPPAEHISVDHKGLQKFAAAVATAGGMAPKRAELLAELLVGNDLRGNFSHGTQQVATYARLVRDGKLNGEPQLKVVKETPLSVLIDGDGGLGYFPAHDATQRVIQKTMTSGMAVGVTRNHGHFGAAGIYARMACAQDLLCFVTSGSQRQLRAGSPLYDAAGGSPMAFTVPAAQESSVVLDFGTMHDLYAHDGHRDEIAALAPGLVLRCIGLGEICQTWGGLLSGLHMDPQKRPWRFPGANQGAMVLAMRIDLFDDPDRFKSEIDEYVRAVAGLKPLEGFDRSYMPGGREEALREQYELEGVPVGTAHRQALEQVAQELDVKTPW